VARSGTRPEWQGRLAVQRGEEDRRAQERKRQAREKARQQEHLQSRQQAAGDKTAEAERRMAVLGEVLTSVLSHPPLSFERLMARPGNLTFDPGPLGVPVSPPGWNDFAPPRPRGLSRFLSGGVRYRRQLAAARDLFAAAQSEYQQKESGRQRALAAAVARYHQELTEERAKAAAQNARLTGRQAAFAAGDPEAVEWFVGRVLGASRYPDGFPRDHQVVYRPENREVVVESELPGRDVVPPVRAYRYVRARDAIEPVPRPEQEIQQHYQRLISAVALRTLHEIFSATPPDVVGAVALHGYVTSTDHATGRPVRPHLLRAAAGRPVFEDLLLAAVEPDACVAYLNTLAPAGQSPVSRSAASSTSSSPRSASR
jgi:restriction system protein